MGHLVKKYRDEQQLSLLQRLQRINMHSLVKKSNRLKYRITSNLGMGTVKDCEFDYLISLLDGAERRLCKFLYCAQIYKRNLELAFKRHEESYKGALCGGGRIWNGEASDQHPFRHVPIAAG